MVAFCRYVDIAGQTRLAVLDPQSNDGQNSPRVCPVADLLDFATEQKWHAENRFLCLDGTELSKLADIEESQWQAGPEQFLPPVDRPEKVICIGLNYLDHAIETGAEPPSEPVVFSKFASTLIGYGQPIVLPSNSSEVDYEAELVVVIGKTTRHVGTDEAMRGVFGYAAGHDVSARDWQKGRPGGQWLLGKTFDTFAPIGPSVVSADEIEAPGQLPVRMHLNNTCVQDSTTEQLIFDIPTLVSHLSQFFTLRPGDLIFTGTPPGVGAARNPPLFLKAGDRCRVEIPGVGHLVNPVVDGK